MAAAPDTRPQGKPTSPLIITNSGSSGRVERISGMTRSLRLGFLAVAVALAAVFAARAEEKKSPQTYVVLVGVSTFDDPAIHARPVAENDAKDLYKLFTNKDHLA